MISQSFEIRTFVLAEYTDISLSIEKKEIKN